MASGPSIYARLLAKIEIENRYLIPKEHLKAPSLRTVYRMLLRIDAYDRAVLMEGKIAADKRFTVVKAGVRSAQILERVEIDHTPLDLFLIDEKSRLRQIAAVPITGPKIDGGRQYFFKRCEITPPDGEQRLMPC